MKIGIFTDTYYPEVNGVVTSIQILQKELIKRGHTVYIFTTSNPSISLEMPNVIRLPSMQFFFLKSKRVGLFYDTKIAGYIRKLKLDIVHTQTEFSLGIFGKKMAKQLGIPVTHTYHTLYKDYVHYISLSKFKGLSGRIVKIFSQKYCNTCDLVIAPSQKVLEILITYGVRKPIHIIPTGIELDKFNINRSIKEETDTLRKQLGLTNKNPVILFVGRVAEEKSIDILIREIPKVINHIPTAKLLIVGEGPAKESLLALVKDLRIEDSVMFAGEHPWEKISQYFSLGDVFVSPSKTETQGLTIIEAMASNIPVIVRYDKNIDGIICDGENGRIFYAESELSGIILETLRDKHLSDVYALNALKTVQKFSSYNFGKSIERLYYDLKMNRNVSRTSFTINNLLAK